MRQALCWAALAACAAGCDPAHEVDVFAMDRSDAESLAPDVAFDRIRDLAVDDESVWVLDRSPPYLTRISLTDGSTVRFGDEGSGPGELLDPVAVDVVSGPEAAVIVWDLTANRASTFTADGRLLDTEQVANEEVGRTRGNIQDITYAEPRRIRVLGDRVVAAYFPGVVRRTADVSSGSLRLAGRDLEPHASLASFVDLTPRTAEALLEFASVPAWDACSDEVVVWDPRAERVLWLSPDGAERRSAPLTLASGEVERQDVERFLQAMLRLEMGAGHAASLPTGAHVEQHIDRFARRAPLVTDVRCGADGAVWLQGFDTSADPVGRGSSWHRVDRDGHVSRFDFPERFRAGAFTEAEAVGVDQDEWGLQRVVRWSLSPAGA